MIIKPFEKSTAAIAELKRLAGLPDVPKQTVSEIEKQIRMIRAAVLALVGQPLTTIAPAFSQYMLLGESNALCLYARFRIQHQTVFL